MTGTTVTSLKRAASALDPAALDELYQHVITLHALNNGKSNGGTISATNSAISIWEERVLYEAIAEGVARALKARSVMPWGRFQQTSLYVRYAKAAALAVETHRGWMPKASRLETLSMLRLYASLVLAYLQADAHAVGWKSVCWALENLPLVVDQHFPNYAQFGLLSMVANLRTKSPK